ncbi:MAG: hypothetical protein CMM50_07785 [Rhodospirillaceae bacterium]|nr:hypothetical protein [Rhodospirillaceae bacterium]
MGSFTSVTFTPLLPWPVLVGIAAVAVLLLGFALARRARGVIWRALMMTALLLVLANPTLIQEQRDALDDVAVLVVDETASQAVGERRARTDEARAAIEAAAADMKGLELRTVVVGDDDSGEGGTRLFEALARSVSDVAPERVAGAILLSDGQIHDVPENGPGFDAPVHLLLTGDRDEVDRRLVLEQAPSYGIVGDELSIAVRVEDPAAEGQPVMVTLSADGKPGERHPIEVGKTETLSFSLDHAGSTAIELSVPAGSQELTLANNRAGLVVNGVRDRLRVMLVSGEPNPGLRTWRNMLKADPSVDLVHFTVLRPPNKQDLTPVRDLSLIPFPTRELFAVNLREFDLIIFDRYHRRGILPMLYLENVVDYVMAGGAVLDSAGPEFASDGSLYTTPLRAILPGQPTGEVLEKPFRPRLTDAGRRHPVTADLPGSGPPDGDPTWGHWYRDVEAVVNDNATVLMSGLESRPILVLDRVGEGRVAQLLSDHSWLWERGHEGGGPQADLLRRLVHWLMKEPELEEEDLRATVSGNRVEVVRRSLDPITGSVTAVSPSGVTTSVPLTPSGSGEAAGSFSANEVGLYKLTQGDTATVAVVGTANPREYTDIRTSPEPARPVVEASGGGIDWLVEDGVPDLRRFREGRAAAGRGWVGLRDNREYLVTGLEQRSLLPEALALLLVLGGLLLAWRNEGR